MHCCQCKLTGNRYLESLKKNARIKEHFIYNEPVDLSKVTYKTIGKIKTITPNMEVSFEMQIGNFDSIEVDDDRSLLWIESWLFFGIRKATESTYYIDHNQYNGLGRQDDIRKSNPFKVSNHWKKEISLNFFEDSIIQM